MKQPINKPGSVSPEKTERIIKLLWHGEPAANTKKRIVYAVLDGARNRKIYPLLEQSGVQYYCLYEGPLDYSLTRAAPYLVRLEEDSDFTRELIQLSWGHSWGIYIAAEDSVTLIGVRRNCKKQTFVTTEEKEKLVFRYYDPRVLRNFLPAFLPDQLSDFFGPVSHYIMENKTASGLHNFTLGKKQNLLTLHSSVLLLDTQP